MEGYKKESCPDVQAQHSDQMVGPALHRWTFGTTVWLRAKGAVLPQSTLLLVREGLLECESETRCCSGSHLSWEHSNRGQADG